MKSGKLALILACGLTMALGTTVRAADDDSPSDKAAQEAEARQEAAEQAETDKQAAKIQAEAEKEAAQEQADAEKKAQEVRAQAEKQAAQDVAARRQEAARDEAAADKKAQEEEDAEKKEDELERPVAPRPATLPNAPTGSYPSPASESAGASNPVGTAEVEEKRQFHWSPEHFGLNLMYSGSQYKNLSLSSGGVTTTQQAPTGHVDFDWFLFKNAGKLGLGASFGFSFLSNVQIDNSTTANVNIFPIEAYLSYRFEYIRHQILVPYVKAGGDVTIVPFNNNAGGFTPGGTYKGLDTAAGVELCLYFIAPHDSRLMDSLYGINDTYIIVEYFKTSQIGSTGPNLARNEIRFGLRFEF